MTIRSYRDLTIWQDAVTLAATIYQVSAALPKEEMYGLTAQLRRAAVSVAANIAEGHGREHTRSFIQFPRIAQGSLKEVETHLIVAERVRLLLDANIVAPLDQCESLGKRMRALIRSLQEKLEREE